MRIAIGGSSGLIGTALTAALTGRGDEVVRLVRRAPAAPEEREWDPGRGAISGPGLDDVDAVVNLAGAGIADKRWSERRKALLLSSRVDTTRTVVAALRPQGRCRTFLSGSAVGYYGDAGDQELTEASPRGQGFLAELVEQWELAALRAPVRTVLLRTGLVLSADGGLLGRLSPVYRLGAGGRIGDGQQYMPWISMADQVRAVLHLLDGDAEGPVNLVGPRPVRNVELTRALAAAVHRPAVVPTPLPALQLLLGPQLVTEALLASQRALPARLVELGFTHRDTDLAQTLAALL
ncbi:TIGR01777 family protein [Auraticoccus sp. F435]|uniref:TIGR01777 family protein n=1 Tax=Auraticoccus cholistanensis TaxID=2656650 RepID=A0A6A9UXP2_9ACTN|nr:TIGR01777 family oxidoreductase [Auraticoccus cholistanensis]MVA76364.1 TIGR01777 family protein [Auraticoccus cholistanensis]